MKVQIKRLKGKQEDKGLTELKNALIKKGIITKKEIESVRKNEP